MIAATMKMSPAISAFGRPLAMLGLYLIPKNSRPTPAMNRKIAKIGIFTIEGSLVFLLVLLHFFFLLVGSGR
jgi:hypothetical protein